MALEPVAAPQGPEHAGPAAGGRIAGVVELDQIVEAPLAALRARFESDLPEGGEVDGATGLLAPPVDAAEVGQRRLGRVHRHVLGGYVHHLVAAEVEPPAVDADDVVAPAVLRIPGEIPALKLAPAAELQHGAGALESGLRAAFGLHQARHLPAGGVVEGVGQMSRPADHGL